MTTALNPGVTTTNAAASSIGNPDDPSNTSAAYQRQKDKWETCRDLMEGPDAIWAAGDRYLTKYPGESQEFFDARVKTATLFNAFQRTVRAATGLVFQKDPVLGSDVDQRLRADCENIDLAGTHIDVFAKDMFMDGEQTGLAGILSEYPRVSDPAKVSLADETNGNLRPYAVPVRAEDILLPRYSIINGKTVLTQLTIREVTEVPVGRFGSREATRYRVYLLDNGVVRFEIWTVPEGGGIAKIEDANRDTGIIKNQPEIPFSPLLLGAKIGRLERQPPLYDLARLNIQHHRINTELLYVQGLACVPTPWRKGVPPLSTDDDGTRHYPPLYLGVQNTIEIPGDVEGIPVGYLSPDITVLDPGFKSLENTERQMGATGLSFLAPDAGNPSRTATAARIDSAAQNGGLASDARALGDCLENTIVQMGRYRGIEVKRGGSVTVNRDFEQRVLDAGLIAAYSNMESAGQIDLDTLWDIMENGQALPAGFDRMSMREAILKRGFIQSTPPNPAGAGA